MKQSLYQPHRRPILLWLSLIHIYYQDIAVKEEDFCPVDPEERIPFEETDTDYKQLQLNMNQGIKGI